MTDTTVKIKSKSGCSKTGVTDTFASRLHAQGTGTRFIAIVEYKVDELGEKDAGNDKVYLTQELIEPVIAADGDTERTADETVRDIMAALAQNRLREENGDQLDLGGDNNGPTMKDKLQRGNAIVERNDLDEPTGLHAVADPEDDPAADDAPDDEPLAPASDDPEMPDDPAAQDGYAATQEAKFSSS